jgi:hypothetical protein
MGDEYNHLGEECKSSKQEKERKFVWVEGQNYTFTFLHGEQFLHGDFWTTRDFGVLKLEGSHSGHVW